MKYIILCGGGGTRLWPLSRSRWPKQFLSLGDEQSLMCQTIGRILPEDGRARHQQNVYIVSNTQLYSLVQEDLARNGLEAIQPNVLAEPLRRNTAPAIALAAQYIAEQDDVTEDDVLVILPADHQIANESRFREHLYQAEALAKQGYIATLGVPPSHPETGYGYIEVQETYSQCDWLPVKRFVEKPDLDTAQRYVDSQRFLWNAGIFVLSIRTLMTALKAHAPHIDQLLAKGYHQALAEFASMPDISFDYAVMEHAQKVAVVPMRTDWSDVGSWDSVYEIHDKDVHENVLLQPDTTFMVDSKHCMVWNTSGRNIALVGMQNCLVVDTPDALLISAQGHTQQVKSVVCELERRENPAAQSPVTESLWWGERMRLNGQSNQQEEVPVYRLTLKANTAALLQGLGPLQLTVLQGRLEARSSGQEGTVRLAAGATLAYPADADEALACQVGPEGAVLLATGSKPVLSAAPVAMPVAKMAASHMTAPLSIR